LLLPRNVKKAKQKLAIKKAVEQLLTALGRDLRNPELKKTPDRVTKLLYEEICEKGDLKRLIQWSPYPYKSAIMVRNHRTYSRCPHHLEKVELDISIAYIPNGAILGVSKLPRIADYFSKGLMLQEEITDGIADAIMSAFPEKLKPLGVGVYVKGRHLCMRSRGVKSPNSEMITANFQGVYLEEPAAREEFLRTL
jgi:GTP cyclohydrolase I